MNLFFVISGLVGNSPNSTKDGFGGGGALLSCSTNLVNLGVDPPFWWIISTMELVELEAFGKKSESGYGFGRYETGESLLNRP
jgi:hypothetical protein